MNRVCSEALERRVRDVLIHIEQNLGADLSLARLSFICQVSPRYFGNIFRQLVGQTPARYVQERRAAGEFWRTLLAAPAAPAPSSEPVPCDLRVLRLGRWAALTLEAARPLRPEDEAAVRAVAAPLLDLLRTRGLLAGSGPEDDTAS